MFGFFSRKRLKIESRSICDRGLARTDNQDHLLEKPGLGLFCVADGMGGGESGGVASGMVCEEIGGLANGLDFSRGIVAIDDAILRANGRIRAYAAERGIARMGTTVAALLMDRREPARVAIANVGDSRVYRRRGIRLERMTQDQRASEYSHLLTQAVGAVDRVKAEWLYASAQHGDIWLLCSDGVHEMLPDSTINALIAHGGSASDIAERIEASVRRAGARDNYSIIVVKV